MEIYTDCIVPENEIRLKLSILLTYRGFAALTSAEPRSKLKKVETGFSKLKMMKGINNHLSN